MREFRVASEREPLTQARFEFLPDRDAYLDPLPDPHGLSRRNPWRVVTIDQAGVDPGGGGRLPQHLW